MSFGGSFDGPESTRVHVSNIDYRFTTEFLKKIFYDCRSSNIYISDSKRYAQIQFDHQDDFYKALEKNNVEYLGKRISVCPYQRPGTRRINKQLEPRDLRLSLESRNSYASTSQSGGHRTDQVLNPLIDQPELIIIVHPYTSQKIYSETLNYAKDLDRCIKTRTNITRTEVIHLKNPDGLEQALTRLVNEHSAYYVIHVRSSDVPMKKVKMHDLCEDCLVSQEYFLEDFLNHLSRHFYDNHLNKPRRERLLKDQPNDHFIGFRPSKSRTYTGNDSILQRHAIVANQGINPALFHQDTKDERQMNFKPSSFIVPQATHFPARIAQDVGINVKPSTSKISLPEFKQTSLAISEPRDLDLDELEEISFDAISSFSLSKPVQEFQTPIQISQKRQEILDNTYYCFYCAVAFEKSSDQLRHLLLASHMRNKKKSDLSKEMIDKKIDHETLKPRDIGKLLKLLNMNTESDVEALAKDKFFKIRKRSQACLVNRLVAILIESIRQASIENVPKDLRSQLSKLVISTTRET